MQDYHLFGLLAQGPRSFVYKARRRRTLSYVCVKRTPRAQQQGVANEVAIHASAGRHVNVLTLYSWYITQRHLYRVIEFCAGGDLGALIAQDGGLPEAAVRLFGIDLLLGLLHCHSRGLLLCDGLRPSGVLLDENGSLRLSDFGNAQSYTDEMRPPVYSMNSSSIARTAPELIDENEVKGRSIGESLHTRASDLWSLGILLYELATGHTPFDAGPQGDNSPASVRKRILMENFPPVVVPVLPSTKKARKTIIPLNGGLKRTEEERGGKEEEDDEVEDTINKVGDNLEEDEEDDSFQSTTSSNKRITLASDTFQDLIGKLLCKDPKKRIDWSELLLHPFWRSDSSSLSGPPPEFQSVLQNAIDLPREIHLERQQRLPLRSNHFLESSGTSLMSTLMGLGTNVTSSQLTSNSLQRSSSKMDEDYADETAQISARLVRPHHPLPASLSSEDERKVTSVTSEGLLDDSSDLNRLQEEVQPSIDQSIAKDVQDSASVQQSTQASMASQSAEIAPELLSLPVRYDPNNTNRSSRIFGAQQQHKLLDSNNSSIIAETVSTTTLLQTQPRNRLILSSPSAEDIISLLIFPGHRLVTPIAAGPFPPPLEPLIVLPFQCPGALLFSQEITSGQDINFKTHLSLLYRALIFADISSGRVLSALNAHPQDETVLQLQMAALAEVEVLLSSGSDSLVNILVNSSISSALAALSRYSIRDSIAISAGSIFARIVQRATNITSTLIFETGLLFSLAESLSNVLSLLTTHNGVNGARPPSLGIPPFRPLSPLSPSFHILPLNEASLLRPTNSETRKHIACAFGEVLFYAVSQSQTEKTFSSSNASLKSHSNTDEWRLPEWLPPFLMHHVLSTSEPDPDVRKVFLHTLCNCLAHLPSIFDQLCLGDLLPNIMLEISKLITVDMKIVYFSANACSMILRSKWFAATSGGENNALLRIDSLESLANEATDSALTLVDSLLTFVDQVSNDDDDNDDDNNDKDETSSTAVWMLLSLGLMSNSLRFDSLGVNKMLRNTISQKEEPRGQRGAAFLVYSAARTSALVRFGRISEASVIMEQALSVFSAIWNRNSAALQGTEGADQDQEFENQYLESCAALFAHTAASGVTTCMLKLSSSDETTTESEELLLFLKACVEVICATPSSVRVLCLFGDGKDKRFEALLSSCLSRNNSPMVMQMSALACSLFNALDDSSCDDEARGLCPSIVRSVLPSALYLLPTKWPVLPLQMSQYVSAEDHAKEEANAALIRLNLWPSLQLIYTALSQPFALSLLHESGSAADLTLAASSTTFAADVAVAARDTLLPCAASLYTSLSEEINYSQNTVEQVEKDEEERSALKVFRSSILDIIRALVFALCGKGGRRGNDIARLVLSPTESVKAILSLCAGALLAPQADIDDQTHQNDCLVCVDLLAAAFKLAQRSWDWTVTINEEESDGVIAPTSVRLLIEALKSRNISDRNSFRTAIDACSAFLLRIAADLSNFQQDFDNSPLDQTLDGAGAIRSKGDLDETINSIKMLEAVVSGTGADVVMPELASTPLRSVTASATSRETFLAVPHPAFGDPLDADSVYTQDAKKAELLDASLDALSSIFPLAVLMAAEAYRNNDLGLLGSASSLLFLLCKYSPIKVAFHALFWTDSSKLLCLRSGLAPSDFAFFLDAPPLRHLLDLVTTAALHLNKNASRISSNAELSLTLILRSCLSLTQASNDVLSAALRMRGDTLISALKGIEVENAEESMVDAEEPRIPKVIRVRVKKGASVTKVEKIENVNKGIIRSIAQTANTLVKRLT